MEESDRFCVSGQGSRNLNRVPKLGVSRIRGIFLVKDLKLILFERSKLRFLERRRFFTESFERVAMDGLCEPLLCSLCRLLRVCLSVNS